MAKLIYQSKDGYEATVSLHEDANVDEYLDTCRKLFLAIGYHNDSWKNAIDTNYEELHLNDKEDESII